MAEWLGLAEVASRPGLDARPVARRAAGTLVRRPTFLADVARWRDAWAAAPGPRVALHTEDTYLFVCALYGAWHAGRHVALPGDTQPATLARLLPTVQACAGDLPGALAVPSALEGSEDQGGNPAATLGPLDPAATRLSVHTSGSSGEPATIAKTLAQLDAEMRTLEAAFGDALGPADADAEAGTDPVHVFASVSHQHIYGLLFHALWPLAAGRVIVSERLKYPEEMAAQLRGRAVLVTSPAHLKRLPEALDWRPARRALRAVFSSGGPLPAEAALAAHVQLGRSPTEVYGSSETGGIACRRRAEAGDRWTPLPGVAWRLGADGQLAVRSPHLPDDAWFETADQVALEGDGFLLCGRADRIVKIEEKRVSLTAMERVLCASGHLLDARVIELPGGAGPRLAVVGVPSDAGRALLAAGKRALNERLREALLQEVERVAVPRRFRYVDALPANPQGKTSLAALQVLFRPARPEPRWVARDATRAVAELDIDPDLRVFDGHFPTLPLLPGVAQVDWAVHFGRACFPLPPRFVRLDVLKFQRPVRPGTVLTLTLTWKPATGGLGFTFASAEGQHASGTVVFGAVDA